MTAADELEPLLLDGPAIAQLLCVPRGTIRRWASAGQLVRRGVDSRGRTVYDYDEVERLVRARDLPASTA